MRDVADYVGMSRQLVSIVLRGAPGASDASRERILAAANELGYHPDDAARMLRRRRSGQIGVIFSMRQPFEVDLVEALHSHSESHGYSLIPSSVGPGRSHATALADVMRQRIEALILLNIDANETVLRNLPRGIPTFLLGGPSAAAHDLVGVDNRAGISLAIDHLLSQGHTRISYVGPDSGPNTAERRDAYLAAMREAGLSPSVLVHKHTEEGGFAAATALLGREEDLPTALVCVNDHCAIGALQTLVRAGVSVPEDISILGFDDSTAAALPFVQLTSVHPDPGHMAQLSIETLHARLENPESPQQAHRVAPTLTVRTSTAPPRSL